VVPGSPPAEAAVLQKALASPVQGSASGTFSGPKAPATPGEEIAPGIFLETSGEGSNLRYTLSGPMVDASFRDALISWALDRS
jgi:hypothetical protein